MVKKTHYRQLARQAERRHELRSSAQARRSMIVRGLASVAAFVLLVGAFLFLRGDERPPPRPPAATESESPEPQPTGTPGEVIDTVIPYIDVEAPVACGGERPLSSTDPRPQYSAPAQVLEENTKYFATITTSCGDIVVKLLPETAPETVNSFVFLAEEGYFDGLSFHRIDTSIDVIQGGDPQGMGTGGPGYTLPDELTGSETYGPGTLAMANSGPNTGGSQFFLIAGENGHLLDDNPAYTVFGQVVEGLDVLQRILAVPIQDPAGGIQGQRPQLFVYIDTVVISNG